MHLDRQLQNVTWHALAQRKQLEIEQSAGVSIFARRSVTPNAFHTTKQTRYNHMLISGSMWDIDATDHTTVAQC